MATADQLAAEFEEHRCLLRGVAYRMLGSVGDAEDIVQEAWLRWTGADRRSIRSARSWLLTVVSRLCLDHLKSARVQREQYYGTWLPEPLVERSPLPPAAEVDESVSIALLLVLEKLSPAERAAFLLHEVFGESYAEVAEVLGTSEVNCRKLVSRARARVRADRPRFTATARDHEALLTRFLGACRAGEMQPLRELLMESSALYSDGGGRAAAVPKVLTGRDAVARFFAGIGRNLREDVPDQEIRFTRFNGAPGILVLSGGKPVTAISLEIRDGLIAAVFAHRNPDKLQWFRE